MDSVDLYIIVLGIVLVLLTVSPAVYSVILIIRTQGRRGTTAEGGKAK